MNFIEELSWRGMIHDKTPGVAEHLNEQKRIGYIGFDPTAPALTLGNFVQIMLLKLFQLSGHQPIVLMGGATGRIGDPSGKDKERDLKSYDELDKNLAEQQKAFYKFLDFEGPNKAIIVNNYDFYKNMSAIEFLRDIGKTMTVSVMQSRESVQRRIKSGISFTEFSYQLLQGYDFQYLFENQGVTLQMGGSDQWGNIISGTEFIRKNTGGKAFAVTTPLLTKADGSKFGKSTEGNVWLDAALTSPYKFYQFWLNAADADIANYVRYFTLKSQEETESLEAANVDNPNAIKRALAEELTVRVHGQAAYQSVLNVSEILFNRKANQDTLKALSQADLEAVAGEIPTDSVPRALISNGINLVDLLAEHTQIVSSKGDARRAIKNNAIAVNKIKIQQSDYMITPESLLHGHYIMVENGKKNKFLISVK